jgi:hypothetical protein
VNPIVFDDEGRPNAIVRLQVLALDLGQNLAQNQGGLHHQWRG